MSMNDRIKKAFDGIHAEAELVEKTESFLRQKTGNYGMFSSANEKVKPAKPIALNRYAKLISAAACLIFAMLGGHWIYFTPTVEISMDINPSIELGVNRFDRIISASSFNDDGRELLDELDIKYLGYMDAVNQILENESMQALLCREEDMVIGVFGADDEQSEEVLKSLETCTVGRGNIYCQRYQATASEINEAHRLGLSYGRYRAYMELKSLDPGTDPEDVRDMTMREIRDRIARLSGKEIPRAGGRRYRGGRGS